MSSSENHRSIAQIARTLRSIVEAETLEHYFWVGGRIDRLYKSDLGHFYFDLVDGDSRIRCVLWEERAGNILFDLINHLDVEIYGDVRFYERNAEAQINVLEIRRTDNTIQAASAIETLRAEGLIPKVKKAPPANIRRVGLLTSRSSRAIGDFETTYQEAGRRAVLAPLSWQYILLEGERAAQSIVDGIQELDANPEVDIIVLIRGGGRTENLAPFDAPEVLRAIISCSKYLVTGIGHHRDHVLADDVADYVVATPTAAANHVADLCMRSQNSEAHRDFIAHRQRRYYKLAFITILFIMLGSLALLAYVMMQYL